MKKSAAKLFLFFLMSASTLALPGMSHVSYDFSINEAIFSNTAIICQNQESQNSGLNQLSTFMNKMNCNNIKDPKKFCHCVAAVSSQGINISSEKAAKIEKVIDKLARERVIKATATRVHSIKNYDALMEILASDYELPNDCFSDSTEDVIFGNYRKKLRRGIELTNKDKIGKQIFENIQKDLENRVGPPKEDILGDASYVTFSALSTGRNSAGINHNAIDQQSLVAYDLNLIEWSNMKGSAMAELLQSNPGLPMQLARIKNTHVSRVSFHKGMFPIVDEQVNLRSSLDFFDRNKIDSSARYMSSAEDGRERELVASAVDSACERVRADIANLIEDTDIEMQVRNIKAALFKPVSGKQKALFTELEMDIADELNTTDDKIATQEFLFNMDILYCRDQKRAESVASSSKGQLGIEELKRDASSQAAEIEVIRKERAIVKGEVRKLNDSIRVYQNEARIRSKRIDFLEGLLSGEHAEVVDGNVIFKGDNSETMKLLKEVDELLFEEVSISTSLGKKYILSKSNVENILSVEVEIDEHEKGLLELALEKQHTEKAKLSDLSSKLSIAKDTLSGIYGKLEKRVGSSNAVRIVADVEREVNESAGHKSGIDYVLANEGDTVNLNIKKKSKAVSSLDILDNAPAMSPAVISSGSSNPIVIDSSMEKQANIVEKSDSSDFFAKSTFPSGATNNVVSKSSRGRDTSIRVSSNKENNVNNVSQREKELMQRLSELEKLNSSMDTNSVGEDVNSESSVDSKIADLKEKIKIEKIKSEKLQVTKELNQLKQQKATIDSPATSVATVNSQSRAQYNQASPSVSKNTNTSSRRSPSSTSSSIASNSSNFSAGEMSASSSSSVSAASAVPSDRESAISDSSNLEKSRRISLAGVASNSNSATTESPGIQVTSFTGDLDEVDARLVKVDFNISGNIDEQEKLLESLFVDGEEEIIVETLEGKKIIVKNKIKNNKIDKKNKKDSIKNKNKMRHQNLIDLLKVGQTNLDI